jgi:hypothetical protein
LQDDAPSFECPPSGHCSQESLAPTENVFLVQLVNPVLFVKARVPADTVEQNNAPGPE